MPGNRHVRFGERAGETCPRKEARRPSPTLPRSPSRAAAAESGGQAPLSRGGVFLSASPPQKPLIPALTSPRKQA